MHNEGGEVSYNLSQNSEETVDTLLEQIDHCQVHFNIESILKITQNELKLK